MTQINLSALTEWHFRPLGQGALEAHAPVGHGSGGELVRFYIASDDAGQFHLTDNYGAVMHLAAHGATFSPNRLQRAGAVASRGQASVRPDGEIVAAGPGADLQEALWDALRISLALSGNQQSWQPVSREDYFSARLQAALAKAGARERVRHKVKVTGASGHQMEFPFGVVLSPNLVRAVQPVPAGENGRADWGQIYQSFGKLIDLKRASTDDADNRITVLDGAMNREDLAKAATVLTEASRVVIFNQDSDAAHLLAA